MKRTPMYERHVRAGAKMVEFAGWEMPIQYSSIMKEHAAVRDGVGLFDVSHMGDLLVSGGKSEELMLKVLTNSVRKHKGGDCVYTHITTEDGKIIDDMIATKFDENEYFCIPNASMADIIHKWFQKHNAGAEIAERTDDFVCIAIQGPKAVEVMQRFAERGPSSLKFFKAQAYEFSESGFGAIADKWRLDLEGQCLVTRTGYTGEDGFELVARNRFGLAIWDGLMKAGADFGIQPIGLGARDTLRLEKGFLLSGTDFHTDRTPLETGWDFAVDWSHDFIGKPALEKQKAGAYQKLCGMKMTDKGIPRHGCKIFRGGKEIGAVTSGTMSPTLKVGIAMGYLDKQDREPGTAVDVEIHGKVHPATVVKMPFVAKK